jgi:hypothetical protein
MDTKAVLEIPGEIEHIGWKALTHTKLAYFIEWRYERNGCEFALAHHATEQEFTSAEELERELITTLNERYQDPAARNHLLGVTT